MYRKFADAVKVPVLANITEFGKTPLFTVDELRSAGVAIVLYPLSAFRAMNKAALKVYEDDAKATARRRTSSAPCRRARSCTTTSTTTPTRRNSMSSSPAAAPKPKKSVALSGVAAGNTALCTVGRTGNDLHYRGYDILDFADQAEFEEVAYLLVHEKLPNTAELDGLQEEAAGPSRHSRPR